MTAERILDEDQPRLEKVPPPWQAPTLHTAAGAKHRPPRAGEGAAGSPTRQLRSALGSTGHQADVFDHNQREVTCSGPLFDLRSSGRGCFPRNRSSREPQYRRSRADTFGLLRPRDTSSSVPVTFLAVGSPTRARGAESGREKEAELHVHDGACARALTQYSVTFTRSREIQVEIHPSTHPSMEEGGTETELKRC